MSHGQMLPGQMSLWHLESVQDGPRNLHLKFCQNWFSNSWDITDIEFSGGWWLVVVVCKVIFTSNPTLGYVRLNWGWVRVLTIFLANWKVNECCTPWSWWGTWPCCGWPSPGSRCPCAWPPPRPFKQPTWPSKLISRKKTASIDRVSLPVEVPLDVPDLVHLVAQQGSELDPKCDT